LESGQVEGLGRIVSDKKCAWAVVAPLVVPRLAVLRWMRSPHSKVPFRNLCKRERLLRKKYGKRVYQGGKASLSNQIGCLDIAAGQGFRRAQHFGTGGTNNDSGRGGGSRNGSCTRP
jgi:hypothetical protein